MTSVSSFAAYSAGLTHVLSAGQKTNAYKVASTDTMPEGSSNPASNTGLSANQAANFTSTRVIFTVNPDTGATVNTTFQVFNGTASLAKISLAPGQLQALQEFQPATAPQAAPMDFNAAQRLLEGAAANSDGTIDKSTLESRAVSAGSNVTQADGLFNALATDVGNGRSINVHQVLNVLESTFPGA